MWSWAKTKPKTKSKKGRSRRHRDDDDDDEDEEDDDANEDDEDEGNNAIIAPGTKGRGKIVQDDLDEDEEMKDGTETPNPTTPAIPNAIPAEKEKEEPAHEDGASDSSFARPPPGKRKHGVSAKSLANLKRAKGWWSSILRIRSSSFT